MTTPLKTRPESKDLQHPKEVEDIEARVDELLSEAFEMRVRDVQRSIDLTFEALELIKYRKEDERKARALNYLGLFYMITGKNEKALNFAESARSYYAKQPDSSGEAFALYTLGSVHYKTANHLLGLEKLYKSLDIWQTIGDRENESRTLKAIGYIYEIFDDYENAVANYSKCLEISREIGDKNGESNACNPLSGIYLKQGKLELADETIEDSIRLKRESGDTRGIAYSYYGKGKVLMAREDFEGAEDYFKKSLRIHLKMNDPLGEGLTMRKLAQVYTATGDLGRAEEYSQKALEIGTSFEIDDVTYEAYHQLYLIAKSKGITEEALEYHEQFHRTRERVLNMESSGRIKARDAIHKAELLKRETTIERLKNFELKRAHDEIELKNKEITRSIRYAQRIQHVILPSEDRWNSEFPESFTLYKPKDIVSGDFYWMSRKKGKVLFAVIDCTGHGIPGAMVSMVAYNGLSQVVDRLNVTKPSSVLDGLNRFVKAAFYSRNNELQEGMDIAICTYHKDEFKLEYSGANHPLLLVRNGKLTEYKPDFRPIGDYAGSKPFKNHMIDLEEGDMVYMFSDGYVDQFGGKDLKKFKMDRLKKLLLAHSKESPEIQRQKLDEAIQAWKGDHIQIDDICIMGVRFGEFNPKTKRER